MLEKVSIMPFLWLPLYRPDVWRDHLLIPDTMYSLFLMVFFDFLVIDDESCEERLWKMKHRGDTNFYLCEVNHGMVIDATFKGNKSRFINHSCEPNTEMQKWLLTILSFLFFYLLANEPELLTHFEGELMVRPELGYLLSTT